jgi:hypothetical protein
MLVPAGTVTASTGSVFADAAALSDVFRESGSGVVGRVCCARLEIAKSKVEVKAMLRRIVVLA